MNREVSTSITVTVTRVVPGPLGGAIVFGRDANGKGHKLVANSDKICHTPKEGEIWTFVGTIEHHLKFGQQLRAIFGYINKPSGKLIIDFLIHSPIFKGIGVGAKKAERLWSTFGDGLYSILSKGDVDKLSLVLTRGTANKLAKTWKEADVAPDILPFLARHGFDIRLANKIRRVWPDNPIQKLLENPYRMLAFSKWRTVDSMARRLGVSKDDPRRMVAAVESILYDRLEAKHTVTPQEFLVCGLSDILGIKGKDQVEEAIERALSEYAVTPIENGYQPRGAAFMEKVIAERFRAMLSGTLNPQYNLFSKNISSIVLESIKSFEGNLGFTLNSEQRAGVEIALNNQLSVLTGGAGVGKTTVLRIINEACERCGITVIQMALSGRAAQRMREATGREAYTIARFLRKAGEGKNLPQSEPLIIIDESSMLDLPLMYSLIRAIPERARLLLVGDPYQLPPIGFGLVFHILAESSGVPKVELVKVHRQAHETGIPQIAHDVRRGIVPQLTSFTGACRGVSFIEASGEQILDSLNCVMSELQEYDDVQILATTKRGGCGAININANFQAVFSQRKKKLDNWGLAEGDPVMYLQNDYDRELWNGSLGRIHNVSVESTKDISLSCTFEGVSHTLYSEDFNKLGLAYAITVHKAQGSQFKRVVIPVVRSKLLDRTLIYTAMTRGIEQVVFIGNQSVFSNAIMVQPTSQGRQVGFSL